MHKPGLFARIKNKQKHLVVISLFIVVIQQLMVVIIGISGEFFLKGKS
jgi:hypothetical protein